MEIELPEVFQFLNIGWWIAHILLISVVFYAGYWYGLRAGKRQVGR
jgi:hypothetical protein